MTPIFHEGNFGKAIHLGEPTVEVGDDRLQQNAVGDTSHAHPVTG